MQDPLRLHVLLLMEHARRLHAIQHVHRLHAGHIDMHPMTRKLETQLPRRRVDAARAHKMSVMLQAKATCVRALIQLMQAQQMATSGSARGAADAVDARVSARDDASVAPVLQLRRVHFAHEC